MGWKNPTKYLQRLGDAMALLCAGHRPPDEMMTAWLDTDDTRLQEFACEHGPVWAQGIAVIDAAVTLADQPTDILFVDGPKIDHERRSEVPAKSKKKSEKALHVKGLQRSELKDRKARPGQSAEKAALMKEFREVDADITHYIIAYRAGDKSVEAKLKELRAKRAQLEAAFLKVTKE